MTFLVRTARPDEYEAIGELTARVYVHAGFMPVDAPYVADLRDAATRGREADLLVATDDAGALAGSVTYVTPGSPYAELATRPEDAEFRMLVVDPTVRKRGVGSALVRACLDRARAQARRTMRLSTDPAMTDAHRLYEHLGFVRTPGRDWSPAPHVTLLAYALNL
ncbi:MAG: GNAT family N-acetyltransferase [Acidothermales bacterium]|nr:GNAT family N-acetyltransferase [Acidothermales bacterium]